MSATAAPSANADREIVITRVFDAPRELVWRAWTDKDHTSQWWGPRGFTSTTSHHDLRVGGEWRHLMVGPDGTQYPCSVYHEIDPPQRLVYSHGWDDPERPPLFEATITFTDLGDNRTQLEMRSLFPTAEDHERAVREVGAVEGGNQTLDRLGEYLATLKSV